MHEQLGGLGVRVYALNVPAFGENAQTLQAFQAQAGLTYPVLNHAGTVGMIQFSGDNTFPYPRDVIVGPDGKIVYTSNVYEAQVMVDIVKGLVGLGQ